MWGAAPSKVTPPPKPITNMLRASGLAKVVRPASHFCELFIGGMPRREMAASDKPLLERVKKPFKSRMSTVAERPTP